MTARGTQLRLAVLLLVLGAFVALLVMLVRDPREPSTASLAHAPLESGAPAAGTAEVPEVPSSNAPQATPAPEPAEQPPPLVLPPAYEGPTHIIGRVSDPSGVALPGAHISASLVRGEFSNPVGYAETDLDGRYEIALPDYNRSRHIRMIVDAQMQELEHSLQDQQLSPSERRALERAIREEVEASSSERLPLVLRVGARYTGYGMAEDSRKLELPFPRETTVDFVLEPGLILEGTVLSKDDGRPVIGASVTLLDNSYFVLKKSASDELGHWWMNLADPGIYQLFARQEHLGTAFEPELVIDPGVDHRMPDLLLQGDGWLAGTVSYPDGRAVDGFVLEARHDAILFLPDSALTESERIQKERGLGLMIGGAITDGHGDFELRGLQPGRFALRFAEVSDPRMQPPLLYATGTQQIALTFGGHRLRVSVRQGDTALLDPPQVTCDKLVVERDGTTRLERVGSWSGAGDWLRVVESGERFLVRASASGTQEDAAVVEITDFPNETVASLMLWPESAQSKSTQAAGSEIAGRIQVSVADAQSHALDGWLATLRSKESQCVVSGMNLVAAGKDGLLPPVAPGEYELTLTCAPRSDAFVRLAATPIDVTVEPTRTAIVEVKAELGARLKLVTHEVDGASVTNPPRITASIGRRDSKDSDRTPLSFVAAKPARAAADHILFLGGSALCEPLLDPGDYFVVIERETGATQRFEVKLETGQVFELDIPKHPR